MPSGSRHAPRVRRSYRQQSLAPTRLSRENALLNTRSSKSETQTRCTHPPEVWTLCPIGPDRNVEIEHWGPSKSSLFEVLAAFAAFWLVTRSDSSRHRNRAVAAHPIQIGHGVQRVERETGFEPATSTLARLRSTE